MLRHPSTQAWDQATVVCGCGGGQAVAAWLPQVLAQAPRLVLDADGLNAVAADKELAHELEGRARIGLHSVLTPHPLEAARLLGCSTAEVQADRLRAVRDLADRSGDVLAGWIAGLWSQIAGARATGDSSAWDAAELAARRGVWLHGRRAERLAPDGQALVASRIVPDGWDG